MFYRYMFEKDGEKTGFLTGLDSYFSIDEAMELGWIFEEKLALPPISMSNTRSYFTEKGNRSFRKAIRKIQEAAEQKGVRTICEIQKDLSDILWKDEKQVVVLSEF